MEQARDGVPVDAAADYERLCSSLRRFAPEPDAFATGENKRILADYEAWSWGYELAEQRWPNQWRDHPAAFARWIEEERQRLDLPGPEAVMSEIRSVAGPGGDDYEAAAQYLVQTRNPDQIEKEVRAFWLTEYKDPEEFVRRIEDNRSVRELPDVATTLLALRIEAVWRMAGHEVWPKQGEEADAVRAVAAATWQTAGRIWDATAEYQPYGWWMLSAEIAQALTPLLAVIEKWRAVAESADSEGDAN